jgi:hypothetical protein
MTTQGVAARLGWRRALARGAAVGAAGGVVLAGAVAATGFPAWSEGVWSFAMILGLLVPVLAVAFRGVASLVWRLGHLGIPPERRQPVPDHALSWVRPIAAAAAACVVVWALLTAVFYLGTGELSPF